MDAAARPEYVQNFLASRDYFCRCGYNLRGLTAMQCPECGRDIHIPPDPALAEAEAQRRLVEFLRTHDIFCKHCRSNLRGAACNRCPQCGATYMLAGGLLMSPRLLKERERERSGVNIRSRLLLLALLSWAIPLFVILLLASSQRQMNSATLQALLLALAPSAILLLWSTAMLRIRRLSGPARWLLGQTAVVLSLAAALLSLALLLR